MGEVEHVLDDARRRAPDSHDLVWYAWPQVWSSTALGFGGVGGQMMTSAQTFVVLTDALAYVYFGGRFAYSTNHRTAMEYVRKLSAPGLRVRGIRPDSAGSGA